MCVCVCMALISVFPIAALKILCQCNVTYEASELFYVLDYIARTILKAIGKNKINPYNNIAKSACFFTPNVTIVHSFCPVLAVILVCFLSVMDFPEAWLT